MEVVVGGGGGWRRVSIAGGGGCERNLTRGREGEEEERSECWW